MFTGFHGLTGFQRDPRDRGVTKHNVDLPCTHDIPSNTKHSVNLYHVLTTYHRTPNTMLISTMHSHPCPAIQNHTSFQVSWIIIFNAYSYSHLISICLTHISPHASQYNKHVIHFSCISSLYQHQVSIIQARISWYLYQLWHKQCPQNNPHINF